METLDTDAESIHDRDESLLFDLNIKRKMFFVIHIIICPPVRRRRHSFLLESFLGAKDGDLMP